MTTSPFNLPKTCWYGLLVAVVLLALPHVEGLPWWTFTSSVVVITWVLGQLHFGLGVMPTVLRMIMAFATLGFVASHYRSIQSLDAYVALLMMLQGQKILEMNSARDLYLAVFIGFIACITRLLFIQAFTDMFVAMATAIVLLFVLYSRYVRIDTNIWRSIRHVLMLLLKATPLIAALFFLFPRIPPLMVIPELGGSGKTGVSGVVEPGNISELARSREPAFRVEFEDDIPNQADLYWRGSVLESFDGRRWTASIRKKSDRAWLTESKQQPLRYKVAMEPSNRNWLFTLAVSRSTDNESDDISGFLVAAKEPVTKQQSYSFEQYNVELRGALSVGQQRLLTRQPSAVNPRAQALGKELAQRFDGQAEFIVENLKARFKRDYVYSLKTPILGANSADEFLFDTKIGYCEHYAHAAAVVLRAAGIPTRLVAGYMGGETNPFQNYLLVRQQDAHAWTEYWQEGKGWIRFDPTAAVAPERIMQGSEASLSEKGELDTGFSSSGRFGIFYNWYLWADAMNYEWARWLEEYDGKEQVGFLEDLTGLKNIGEQLVSLLIGAALLVTLPFGIWAMASAFRLKVPLGFSLAMTDRALRIAGLARPLHRSPKQWQRDNPILPSPYRKAVKLWYAVWFLDEKATLSQRARLFTWVIRLWVWAMFYHLTMNPNSKKRTKRA